MAFGDITMDVLDSIAYVKPVIWHGKAAVVAPVSGSTVKDWGQETNLATARDNQAMRINLVTPFAEKDAVKALGARWDAKNKNWYIVDVADLSPFMRWIPDMNAATVSSNAGNLALQAPLKAAPLQVSAAQSKKPTIELPHCGCNVLPWEDCLHTVKA